MKLKRSSCGLWAIWRPCCTGTVCESMGIDLGLNQVRASSKVKKLADAVTKSCPLEIWNTRQNSRNRSLKHWNCHVWVQRWLSPKNLALTDAVGSDYAVLSLRYEPRGGALAGSRCSTTSILHPQHGQTPISQPVISQTWASVFFRRTFGTGVPPSSSCAFLSLSRLDGESSP